MHRKFISTVVFVIAGLLHSQPSQAQDTAPAAPAAPTSPAAPTTPIDMDPHEVFNDLFGGDVKRVRITSSVADDLELAVQLLGSAETVASTPKLLVVICRESIQLASMDTAGLPIVLKAIAMMKQHGGTLIEADFPSGLARLYQTAYVQSPSTKRGETGEKLIDVLLQYGSFLESLGEIDQAVVQYRRADTVARAIDWPSRPSLTQRITDANSRKALFTQIAMLKRRLTLNPKDAASAEELIFLYLFELDQPSAAQSVAEKLSDATVTKQVSLAAQPADSLADADAANLSLWYEKLLNRAKSDGTKANVLTRLVLVLDRSLALHTDQDLDRLRIKVKRDRFADELTALQKSLANQETATATKTSTAIDLVKLVDTDVHAVSGDWEKRGSQVGQLANKRGALLRIPVVPEGNYEFTAQFTRSEGDKAIGFNLPLGDTSVALFLGWSGKVDGIARINREDVSRNASSKPTKLSNGRRNTLVIRVMHLPADEVQINATLNGESVVSWKGARASLSEDRSLRLDAPLSLGINGWNSTVVYHSLSLKMLSGEAKMVADTSRPKKR